MFIFDKVVVKVPYYKNWKRFLKGLIANLNEAMLSKSYPESQYLVPVTWSAPGGWLLIMPRVRDCGDPLFHAFMVDLFKCYDPDDQEVFEIRRYCECIVDNYGMYKGQPRCRDYGTYIPEAAVNADIDRVLNFYFWGIEKRIKRREEEHEAEIVLGKVS